MMFDHQTPIRRLMNETRLAALEPDDQQRARELYALIEQTGELFINRDEYYMERAHLLYVAAVDADFFSDGRIRLFILKPLKEVKNGLN